MNANSVSNRQNRLLQPIHQFRVKHTKQLLVFIFNRFIDFGLFQYLNIKSSM